MTTIVVYTNLKDDDVRAAAALLGVTVGRYSTVLGGYFATAPAGFEYLGVDFSSEIAFRSVPIVR